LVLMATIGVNQKASPKAEEPALWLMAVAFAVGGGGKKQAIR